MNLAIRLHSTTRSARFLVGKPKAALRSRWTAVVDKIIDLVDSGFAGDPVWRWSTMGSVALIGNQTVKSGLALQSLTALSDGEAEFSAVVKGGQVGLSLRSMYQDLGIPMKVEIQSDCSLANALTDRLGAGPRTNHTLIRSTFGYKNESKTETSVSRRFLQRKLCRCWNEASLCFSTAATLLKCRISILLT